MAWLIFDVNTNMGDWIHINKNTFKAYYKKNCISNTTEQIKVIIEDKFDGSVDCVMPVNEEGFVSIEKLLDYGRYIIYDTAKDRFRAISLSVGSYTIIDDRFEKLKEVAHKQMIIKSLGDKTND